MLTLNEIASALTAASDRIEELENENKSLRDRLIHAQSEALAAAKKAEPKPAPQCIGKENVISFVTTKSAELQVSPGVVWGMVLDALKKSDAFGKPKYKVGDKVRMIGSKKNWTITAIITDNITKFVHYYAKCNDDEYHPFLPHEIEPAAELKTPPQYEVGDKVRRMKSGKIWEIVRIDTDTNPTVFYSKHSESGTEWPFFEHEIEPV